MNADGLKELFEPFGSVEVKRMFGGSGVYAEDLCFAIESGGDVFLKVDAETEAAFSAAGSSPFVYNAKGKRGLRRWAALAPEAARRKAAKAKPAKKRARSL